jgi:predicted P-loop ATPase
MNNSARDEALRFLALLGKDPAASHFRFFPHKKNPRKLEIKARSLKGFDPGEITRNQREQRGAYVVIGNGGTKKEEITDLPALFVEWDDKPVDWQRTAWQELGLPEPSIQVETGGKSVHSYWVLSEPMPTDQWLPLLERLIKHCGSDEQCDGVYRVMRLPGAYYIDANGKQTTQTRITLDTGKTYQPDEILPEWAGVDEGADNPPDDPQPTQPRSSPRREHPPRSLKEVREALQWIPEILPGTKQRMTFRNLAWGLLGAVREAGEPDEMALALLQEHSPAVADAAEYYDTEPHSITAASFWKMARNADWKPATFSSSGNPEKQNDNNGNDGSQAHTSLPRRIRLSPHDVARQLPNRLGRIRRNVRTGDVVTDKGAHSANDISRLYIGLSNERETWPKEATADAVAFIANSDTYDPVQQYLEGIATPPLPMEQWQRLDLHLLGIDHPIAAAFLPRYLISAVARTMEPGCDVRQVLVLIGPQWRGKSELGETLFGKDHWIPNVKNLERDDLMRFHRAWGVELAEFNGVTRRNDPEKLKSFITEKVDTYRAPYERGPDDHPRRFVFWGTANQPPLSDPTGSTRFVCIKLPDRMLPLDWAKEHRNAIWARALEQYRSGVQWSRTTEEERQAIEEMNSDFEEHDPWAEEIEDHLRDAQSYDRLPVKIPDLLERLQVPRDRHNPANAKRVRVIAARFGWEHRRYKGRLGLWPPEPASVQGVHRSGTHTYTRPDASDSGRSGEVVHTLHTFSQTKGETREGGKGQTTTPPEEQNAEKFAARPVQGVQAAETDCAPTDQPVHPSEHPTRAQPRTITSKPPTFTVDPWANARPIRTDAEDHDTRSANPGAPASEANLLK